MFKDFILNITLLISFFAITGQMMKNVPRVRIPSIRMKVVMGLGLGILGIILMQFTIQVTSTLIADLRHIAIIIAALYGGIPAALISSLMIAIGRITLFPMSDVVWIISLNMLLIGLVCSFLSQTTFSQLLKSLFMNIFSLIFITISFYLIIEDKNMLFVFLPYHYATSLIGGLIAYHLVEYILLSNAASHKIKESEERYRRLVIQSPDPMIIHDGKVILFANDKATALLGVADYSKIVGKSTYDFIHPDDHGIFTNRNRKIFDSEEQLEGIELKIINLDGREIDIEISSNFITYKDKLASQMIFRDITERKKMEKALKKSEARLVESNRLLQKLSMLDGLTEIPNRRHFEDRLKTEWSRAARTSSELSVILLDIDYFKKFNDTYGHQAGDDCLTKVAQSLQEALNRPSDFVARYGGEEFVVILPDTDYKGASVVAEMLRKKVEELEIPHEGSEISTHITISLGIATTIPLADSDPQDLIAQADKMLYQAKREGRNKYTF